MPSEFELRGAVKLARVAKALQEQSDTGKGFRKGLQSGLVKATKPARKDLKAAIPNSLPRSGGLAAKVSSDSSFVLATNKNHGAAVAVRIQGKRRGLKGGSLRRFNSGTFRHPVFKRDAWVSQSAGVTKGFLDRAFAAQQPRVKRAVLEAINNTRNAVYRSFQ